jgi:hypothetical protein
MVYHCITGLPFLMISFDADRLTMAVAPASACATDGRCNPEVDWSETFQNGSSERDTFQTSADGRENINSEPLRLESLLLIGDLTFQIDIER